MATVLIAVDDSDSSVPVTETARRLFGDDASYLVINVGDEVYPGMAWGYAYPYAGAWMWPGSVGIDGDTTERTEAARERAEQVVDDAAIDAVPLGEVGDASTAILRAAAEHAVDVVVVGSHERSWFDRLLRGSVRAQIIKEAQLPVLVVN